MNDYLLEMELRQRRREFLEEAARKRLIRLHDDTRPVLHKGVRYRFMALAGNLLISMGQHLLHRSASATVLDITGDMNSLPSK